MDTSRTTPQQFVEQVRNINNQIRTIQNYSNTNRLSESKGGSPQYKGQLPNFQELETQTSQLASWCEQNQNILEQAFQQHQTAGAAQKGGHS